MSEESRGQQIRRNIRSAMEGQLHKYCPNMFSKMANLIAYDFNLTPDTVKYNYLNMFIENGILIHTNNGELDLSAKGKVLQTTEDGLTKEQLQEEYEEEIVNLKELKKEIPTFDQWKKTRPSRKRPIEP
jgi:hypothetical protein